MIFYTVAGADAMFVDQGAVVAGSVLIGIGAGEAGSLDPGTDGQVLTVDTGVPEGLAWVTPITAAHEHNTANTVAVAALKWDTTTVDASSEFIDDDTFLAQAEASSPSADDPVYRYPFSRLWSYLNRKLRNFTTVADGSLPVMNGNNLELLAPGSDGYVLLADATEPLGVKWADTGSLPTPTATPPPQVDIFRVNGTWTKPAGAKRVHVLIVGGGGGGGGAAGANPNTHSHGGGGAAGGAAEVWYDASVLSATMPILVGAGGAGGAGNATGGTGGNSCFGVVSLGDPWPVAHGGAGGASSGALTASDTKALGGYGGAYTTGVTTSLNSLYRYGASGGTVFGSGSTSFGGDGGASLIGGGGKGTPGLYGNGTNAYSPGAGGGGASAASNAVDMYIPSYSGGAGAAGIVIATTYF